MPSRIRFLALAFLALASCMEADAAQSRRFHKSKSNAAVAGCSETLSNTFSTEFNGGTSTGYVSVADALDMEFGAHASFSVWVHEDSLNTADYIINKYDPGVMSSIEIRKGAISSKYQIFVAVNSTDNSTTHGLTSGTPATTGWNHLVVVFDGTQGTNGGKLKLYVGGVDTALTFTGTMPATLQDTDYEWGIGGRQAGTLQWDSNIDEVAFYRTSLTQGQVTTLYNGGTPNNLACLANASDLAMWLRMGDGDTGTTTLNDQTAGNHDGTLNSNLTSGSIDAQAPP